MSYTQRFLQLNTVFRIGEEAKLSVSNVHIKFVTFKSDWNQSDDKSKLLFAIDDQVRENEEFQYPVFIPSHIKKSNEVLLLLHGLNERNWGKYLVWAEQLCLSTQKPVLLFPIAYHINRTPKSWYNPRELMPLLHERQLRNGADRCLSVANVTFSERVSEQPMRFYSSGRQSLHDVSQLMSQIKSGQHELFDTNANVDIFAYSIGAFLAEIILMLNPQQHFTNSKLFLFCGGGVFSSMFGQSRCIMDKVAYQRLLDFYMNDFSEIAKQKTVCDRVFDVFQSMLSPQIFRKERLKFFSENSERIAGLSLRSDKVMPFSGVEEALGKQVANNRILRLENEFEYSHENPFPVYSDESCSSKVDGAFAQVFEHAACFLAS